MSSQLYIVIISALIFEFINGMRDSSNIVATMISSRAFSPRMALGMTAVAEFFGPFLFGITVAKTIGSDIVDSNLITLDVLLACLCGSIVWNLITWFFGIPSSSSHALIGGLIGAAIVSVGWQTIKLEG
ncbi:MAG: inorganic phosphate transporter, partial [Anaerolineales bacterium]|nr:inorganic phosphate transporter [Anaerolineales bacterium]